MLRWHILCKGKGVAIDSFLSTPTINSLRMVMDEAALHQQAISSNIANVNTPGYKRLDVSATFEKAISSALGQLNDGEAVQSLPPQRLEVSPVQGTARADGNTVQMEQEMLGLAQNTAKFEFAGQMLSNQYRTLNYAITGQGTL